MSGLSINKEVNTGCCVPLAVGGNMADYWDSNFKANEVHNWSELKESLIIEWIRSSGLSKEAVIFCAGVGDSFLVDSLISEGFTKVIANDISQVALDRIHNRIGSHRNVIYMKDDLMNPSAIKDLYGKVDFYVDRATLHFFKSCEEKDFYFAQINRLLTHNGGVILGVFSKNNEPKCCGLDLQLWSLQSLKNRLKDYNFITEATTDFIEPSGRVREYIWLQAQANN